MGIIIFPTLILPPPQFYGKTYDSLFYVLHYVCTRIGGWSYPPAPPPVALHDAGATGAAGVRLSYPVPVRQTADATYLSRDEVETEIF